MPDPRRIVFLAAVLAAGVSPARAATPATRPTLEELKIALAERQKEVGARVESTTEYKALTAEVAKDDLAAKELKSAGESDVGRLNAMNASAKANRQAQRLKADAVDRDIICRALAVQIVDAEPRPEAKGVEDDAKPSAESSPLSLLDVIKELPADARPAGEWDEFSIPKAHAVVSKKLVDNRIRSRFRLKSAAVRRLPDASDPDKTVGWALTIVTSENTFTAFGQRASEQFYSTDAYGGVTLSVPEALARDAKNWRADDLIEITGTVGRVEIVAGKGRSPTRFLVQVWELTVTRISGAPPATPTPGSAPTRHRQD